MKVLVAFVLLGIFGFLLIRSFNKDKEEPKEEPLVEYPVIDWAETRGQQGEEEVRGLLSQLPKTEYVVLNDVLLPGYKGTTQIDHVVVSLYGIFVIESKNYSGKIYGSHDSEKWSQYINGEENTFRNPIKQNQGHVIAIEKLLRLGDEYMIPIVVFTGSATLKLYGCDEVIYDGMLLEKTYRHRDIMLTPAQMVAYAGIIDDRIDENPQTKSAHLCGVKERVAMWNQEVDAGLCPRCDGHLVLRKGKYGDFFGCSNYPKCKYTKNI